jgi:cell division protein FtsI (penicillin-binding protein 3)
VAGKTGTAQKAGRGGYSLDKVVASFAGYVPADRPRLAILVVVDEPKGGQYGGAIAAPVFKEIAESSLRYLGVAPSLPARTLEMPQPMLAAFSQVPAVSSESAGVPDLRGLDARAAIRRAAAAGLVVRADGSGVVTSQLPNPGGALPRDRQIRLTLSDGGQAPSPVVPAASFGQAGAPVLQELR